MLTIYPNSLVNKYWDFDGRDDKVIHSRRVGRMCKYLQSCKLFSTRRHQMAWAVHRNSCVDDQNVDFAEFASNMCWWYFFCIILNYGDNCQNRRPWGHMCRFIPPSDQMSRWAATSLEACSALPTVMYSDCPNINISLCCCCVLSATAL